MRSRSAAFAGASVIVFMWAGSAYAQTAAADQTGIEEIIVTAQKREQRLQEVPVAVTAISEDTLRVNRVQSVNDLSGLAPGLVARNSAGNIGSPTFIMRGVAANGAVPVSDRQISQYLDGVYLGGNRGVALDLPDIERIEVLRGPQGTLFGRNATAGAISIVTRNPSGELGVQQELTVGNYDQLRTRTTIDTPTWGPLSGFVTFVHDERRGDVRNLGAGTTFDRTNPFDNVGVQRSPGHLGGRNSESIFAALRLEATSELRMTYKFDRVRGTTVGDARASVVLNPNDAVGAMLIGVLAAQPAGGGAYGLVTLNPDHRRPDAYNNGWSQQSRLRNYGHNLTTEWQASDRLSFRNITAYRRARVQSAAPIAGLNGLQLTPAAAAVYFPFAAGGATVGALAAQGITSSSPGFGAAFAAAYPATLQAVTAALTPQIGNYFAGYEGNNGGRLWQFSSELQANFQSDLATVTAGVIYYKSSETAGGTPGRNPNFAFTPLPRLLPLGNIQDNSSRTRSVAAYIQGDFHLTPQIDIQVGGRVTRDSKSGALTNGGAVVNGELVSTPAAPIKVFPYTFKKTKPTYSIGVNYHPNDDIMFYGKFSTAYLSGGAVEQFAFAPETVRSYEIGLKSEWLDRRLRVNLVAYDALYKHAQAVQSGSTVGRLDLSIIVLDNGPLRSHGFEAEVVALPIDGLTLSGSLGYQTSKLTSPNPLLTRVNNVAINYRNPSVPRWTSNLSAQYVTQPLFDDATMLFRLDANYRSQARVSTDADIETNIPAFGPYEFNPGRTIVNGRIALRNIQAAGSSLEVGLWGRNLTNNRAPMFPIQFSTILITSNYQEARTFGIDLIGRF